MQITYLGHSSFKLKGRVGTVITDPFLPAAVGLSYPSVSADLVTVSHQHDDHNAFAQIKGTTRRPKPFLVSEPGEYEVGGISVFGFESYHDQTQGAERGSNTIFLILIDDIRVCHLGDLGHQPSTELIEAIGSVDLLLCPVGGVYTLDPSEAVKTIRLIEPALVIPMHYRTPQHRPEIFADLKTATEFLQSYGTEAQPELKLELTAGRLPEETELHLLTVSAGT